MNCPAGKLGNYPHCHWSEGLDIGGKCSRKKEGKSHIISQCGHGKKGGREEKD